MKRLLDPAPWPITGNLLQLGKDTHIIVTKLRDKYGDIFQAKLRSVSVVVLCGTDVFKQFLEI